MRVFITGGAGFIGGHLTEALIRRGDHVRVLDDLSTGTLDNLTVVSDSPRFEFIRADVVQDHSLVRRCVKEADAVIHLAAAVGVELVVKEPASLISQDIACTVNKFNAEKFIEHLLGGRKIRADRFARQLTNRA